jgi:hypothetical protein
MSVDADDEPDADILASLSHLRRRDVSPARARRLRRRCHALLRVAAPEDRAQPSTSSTFRRVAVPGIAAAWCVAYLTALVRYTIAIYAAFGAN